MSGTTTPSTPGVVAFDFVAWSARYPELSTVSQPQAQAYFVEAGLYLGNTGASPVQDLSRRALILNMVTAHIAALAIETQQGDSQSPALVGRIASASEGSVSVSTAFEVPGTASWFAQTQYGASAWAAMAPYRMARFYPGARRRW